MFSSQNVRREELKLISVFNTRNNTIKAYDAMLELNDTEALSLGEVHKKIFNIETVEDEKRIKHWFHLSEAKLIKYVKADPTELEILYSEYKNSMTTKEDSKNLFDVQRFAEWNSLVGYDFW